MLGLAALATYANALDNPFVFDDLDAIVWNPHVRQLWPPGEAMSALPNTPGAGRPLVSLSLALNYAIGGMSVGGYHVANLAIHLGCALLLFGILRRTFAAAALSATYGTVANRLAFAGALLWLLHPVTSEVVNYVTQRTESMMAFCYLLTIYSLVCAAGPCAGPGEAYVGPTFRSGDANSYVGPTFRSGNRSWALLAVLASAAGMACKESMVTAPVMAFLFDAVFLAGTFRGAWRMRRALHLMLASTWCVLGALVLTAPRPESLFVEAALSSGGAAATNAGAAAYLLAQAGMVVQYLRVSLIPIRLVFDYGPLQPTTVADVAWQMAIVAAIAALTAWAWWKDRRLGFAGVWFFVTLAPASSIVPIIAEVGAERRMYLPLAAVMVLAVVAAWHAGQWLTRLMRSLRLDRAFPAALACAACVLAALTIQRNAEYGSPSRLWATVVARHPHGRAIYNLGESLKQEGHRDQTLELYGRTYREYPDARYALASELDADGKREEAIAHYREYIRERPFDRNALTAENRLARALTALGHYDEATAAYEHLLSIVPRNFDAHSGLGDVLMAKHEYSQAVQRYRQCLALVPDPRTVAPAILSDLYAHLGLALVTLNRTAEAVPAFAQAAALAPADGAKEENLANALAETGDLAAAIDHYRAALAKMPRNAPLRSALGTALLAQGRREEAFAEFDAAMRLDPNNPAVRMDVAAAFDQLGLRTTRRAD